MVYIDFVGVLHKKTSRDYLQRVIEHDKAEAAKVASNFDFDYWDGDRSFGFGGYNYDGRWSGVADSMIKHYKLNNESKILDGGNWKFDACHVSFRSNGWRTNGRRYVGGR